MMPDLRFASVGRCQIPVLHSLIWRVMAHHCRLFYGNGGSLMMPKLIVVLRELLLQLLSSSGSGSWKNLKFFLDTSSVCVREHRKSNVTKLVRYLYIVYDRAGA